MITLTQEAIAHLHELIPLEERADKGLRIYVDAGGCSGLQYEMKIDKKHEGDETVEFADARVFLDRASTTYLRGSKVTFESGLINTGFRIMNPNAKNTCGCGNSFEA